MTLWALFPISFYAIVLNAHPAVYFGASLLICLILLKKREFNASAAWLGLAVLFQYVGLLLLPLIIMELKRFAPTNAIKTCSAYFVGSALLVSLPLLLARYGGVWFVQTFAGPLGFIITRLTNYRGADQNLLSTSSWTSGINTPSFLYTGSAVLTAVLLLYLIARPRLSTELWVTVLLVGIFLVYPQLHLQHLIFALPLILISKLRPRVAFLYNLIAVPAILSWDRTNVLDKTIRTTLGLTYAPNPNLDAVRATYFVTTIVLIYVLVEIYRVREKTKTETHICQRPGSMNLKIGIRCIAAFVLLIVIIGACSAQAFPKEGVLDQSQVEMNWLPRPGSNVTEAYTWMISRIDSRYYTAPLSNLTTFVFELHANQILPPFQVYFNHGLIINATQLAGTETAHWKPKDDGARRATVENQNGSTIFTDPFAYVASWTLDLGSVRTPASSVILILRESPGAVVEVDLLRNQTVQYTDVIANETWSAHSYSLVSDGRPAQLGNNTQTFLQGIPMPVDQLMIRIKPSRAFPFSEQVAIDSLVVTNAFLPESYDAVVVVPSTLVNTQSRVLLTTPSMNVDSISLSILLDAASLKPVPILQNSEALLLLLSASAETPMLLSSYPAFTSKTRLKRLERILRFLKVQS